MEIKDLKQHIKELMSAMVRNGMKRLVIKHEDLELELERSEATHETFLRSSSSSLENTTTHHEGIGKPLPSSTSPLPHEHGGGHSIHHEKAGPSSHQEGNYITSPMVGTFYASSSPESDLFVKVGENINKDDVVCIIEAMKVMNEIKAGISGVISEILVSNGDPVEFGSKLFKVR